MSKGNGDRYLGEPFTMKVSGSKDNAVLARADVAAAVSEFESRDGVRIVMGDPLWVDHHEKYGPHWHADGHVAEILGAVA